jgi:hypothetical protein
MVAGPGAFRIEGITELRAALRELGQVEDAKEFQQGLKDAAGIVAREAKLRANTFSFRASDTIRAGSSGRNAYVAGGKGSLPWYGWADFGSRIPVRGNPRSRGPWSGSGRGPARGRFIYPAFDATEREVAEKVADAIDVAAQRAGLT